MLLQRRAAKGIEQDLECGVSADLVQCLALVLEDFLTRHRLGLDHALLGRAMHVFHQIACELATEQCVLLFDEGAGGGIGQVLDSLAAEDRQDRKSTRLNSSHVKISYAV